MQTANPTFSIIITTFNRLELLKRCLNSLKEQSFKSFEVIVYDDGSLDGTKEFFSENLASWQADLPGLQYIWKENWGGPAKGRNYGMSIARGEWISFLDSDDWWYPNRLENMTKFLQHSDVIYHELQFFNSNGQVNKTTNGRHLKPDSFKDLLVNGNCLSNSATVFRRSLAEDVGAVSEEDKIKAVEDYDYWIRLAKAKARFQYIPETLGAYWVGDDNISQASVSYLEKLKFTLNQYLSELDSKDRKQAELSFDYIQARNFQAIGGQDDLQTAKGLFKKVFFHSSNLMLKLKSLYCLIKIG